MKRLALVIASVVAATSFVALTTPTAQAAVKCSNVSIKQSTPLTIKQPFKPANPLPKKLTFNTNCGIIEVTLNPKAPQTITNLAALARGSYFNNTFCHRLTTQGLFVLQCGDPTFTGGGNPTGWKGYKEENLPKQATNNYPVGTVAMANAGKGTNGSQMFFVYADTTLGPDYTIFGKITKGLDIIQYVASLKAVKQGTDGKWYYNPDGYPFQTVKIISVKVS